MDKKKEKKRFEIPKKGSLGLLAAGHLGLRAWRKVRDDKKKTNG